MQITFVSNYYPPFAQGGYEQWCQEVAVELVRRGHRVSILTSRPPGLTESIENDAVEVWRSLHLEVESGVLHSVVRLLRDRERLERENLMQVRRMVVDFAPDAVLLWGMWNVPRSVPALVEQLLPGRLAYFLCDYWLTLPNAYIQQWQNSSSRALTRLPKRLAGQAFLKKLLQDPPIPLQLEHPICVSQAVRELLVRDGVPLPHARIIQGGIQVDDFKALGTDRWERTGGGLKLLYAGRLTSEKGVSTAIRALAQVPQREDRPVTLDLLGGGDPRYHKDLKNLVRQSRLESRVKFRRSVPRSEMPTVLAEYDALLFPSEWAEPFSRIVMEAMAAGLVVIGTTTGGTGDVLVEDLTGLTFPPGDARALAGQIQHLRDSRMLGHRLSGEARRRVERKFTFERMVDEIEAYLESLAMARSC